MGFRAVPFRLARETFAHALVRGAASNSLFLVLHGAFFRYNPAQRANLYFALYAGSVAFYSLGQYPYSFLRLDTGLGVYAGTNALIYFSNMWAVRALYALFGVRPGRNYRRLWLMLSVLLPLSVCQVAPEAIDYCYSAFFALATAQQLRLTGRALRQRGAVTIGVGFATGLLFLLLLAGLDVALSDFVANLFIPLIYLPPGLGISLFLAREFALDSQLLQLKLHEVEQLSARAQEQEKQALLAQQNETLE